MNICPRRRETLRTIWKPRDCINSIQHTMKQGPRSDFVIGGASEREARAFARGVRGDAPREILKFRPSAMAKNATKFVSCDKVCPIFI